MSVDTKWLRDALGSHPVSGYRADIDALMKEIEIARRYITTSKIVTKRLQRERDTLWKMLDKFVFWLELHESASGEAAEVPDFVDKGRALLDKLDENWVKPGSR